MEAKLVRIGNSKGIRLPKSMLAQTGMTERIEIEVQGNVIILKPFQGLRSNWDASFAKSNDALTIEDHDWLEADLSNDAESNEGENW